MPDNEKADESLEPVKADKDLTDNTTAPAQADPKDQKVNRAEGQPKPPKEYAKSSENFAVVFDEGWGVGLIKISPRPWEGEPPLIIRHDRLDELKKLLNEF